MKRIAVIAHKGGMGKTTVALNLGAALAANGQRVVLVDCDPQGALGATLGITTAEKPTLYEVITSNIPITEAVKPTGIKRLALVAADLDLSGLEVELPQRTNWQTVLRSALEGLEEYDVMVIDTPPGLGVLAYSALVASTEALVVTSPEFLAYRAVSLAIETIERAQKQTPTLTLLGIVPNFATRQTRHASEVLDVLREDYGQLVLSEIPRRVAVQDAALASQPLRDYDPKNDATKAFSKLAKEVLAHDQSSKSA